MAVSTELELALADQLAQHTPGSRAFCRNIAAQIAPALDRADHRHALLRSVLSFVDVNNGDLPLPLVEAIRVEVGPSHARCSGSHTWKRCGQYDRCVRCGYLR